METRLILAASKQALTGSTTFIARYLNPLFANLYQQVQNMIFGSHAPQQIPLALPAPSPVLLLMPAPDNTTQPTALPAPQPVLLLMPPPAPDNTTQPTQKKSRPKSAFSANKTASISLAKKQIPVPQPSSYSLSSLLFSTVSVVKNIVYKSPVPATADNDDDIRSEMERLQALVEGHPDPDSIVLQQVELVTGQIRLHAQMRVHLFLHLLLAVRGTGFIVSKGKTIKQHGTGSQTANTQACHSFIIPHVQLEVPANPSVASTSWTATLFSSKPAKPWLKPTLPEELDNAFNVTFELPAIVNGFDGHLEGRFQQTVYIKEILEIVNKVSRDEDKKLDSIIDGMNAFFKSMEAFFIHMDYDYIRKPNRLDYPKAFARVWECEKMGTLDATIDGKLDMEYLYNMLGIHKFERAKCRLRPGSLKAYYEQVQKDIFEAISDDEFRSKMNIE